MTASWGLLGPEILGNERRDRTLQIGPTIRFFNERAVPGLGGIWFLKQIHLALLGVEVAGRVRTNTRAKISNIETANAVEALACWMELKNHDWPRDLRLRGRLKLREKTDLTFSSARRPSFYVTQPMRMATVQPLRMLGLVDAETTRFNAYQTAKSGIEFLEAASEGFKPSKRSVIHTLVSWASGAQSDVATKELNAALSPRTPINLLARDIFIERLVSGSTEDAARRRAAFSLVKSLSTSDTALSWNAKPGSLTQEHWDDLHSGSLFFSVLDEALNVLDKVESVLDLMSDQKITIKDSVKVAESELNSLKEAALLFVGRNHDPSPDLSASKFSQECANDDLEKVVTKLVLRDGVGLQLRDAFVIPGSAFRGQAVQRSEDVSTPEQETVDAALKVPFPKNVSYRMQNLFLLNQDFDGNLDRWILKSADEQVV